MVFSSNITPINGDITLSYDYDVYIVDGSLQNITLTLPNIVSDGIFYNIKRIDNSTNTVTITGSQTIDNQSSIILRQKSNITLNSLNNLWYSVQTQSGMDTQISMHGSGSGYKLISQTKATTFDSGNAKMIYRGSQFYGGNPVIMTVCCSLDATSSTPQTFTVRLQNITTGIPTIVSTITGTVYTGPTTYYIFSTYTFNNVQSSLSIWDIQTKLGTSTTAPTTSTNVRFHWIYVKFC